MVVQIEIDKSAVIGVETDGGAIEIADDLAYLQLAIVNVMMFGRPGAGDRGWILIDAGIAGSRNRIGRACEARFGEGARPSAIVLTHGHFDHVGVVETLAEEWDAPVYAHPSEHPFLDGSRSYPDADPSAGGGLMALLSPLYPTKPVDLGARLRPLPQDGTVPGMEGWSWVHTPGHTPGHVSLWHQASRTLIAGDAVITTGQESAYEVATQKPEIHGPPRYFTPDWAAAEQSVRRIDQLGPETLVTGHGPALRGPAMQAGLRELAARFREIATPER